MARGHEKSRKDAYGFLRIAERGREAATRIRAHRPIMAGGWVGRLSDMPGYAVHSQAARAEGGGRRLGQVLRQMGRR
jgi:hypothetical protein